MKRAIYLLTFWMLAAVTVQAQDLKIQADSAYVSEHYAQAAQLYEQLLEQGRSSEVYYNLGNCYYRLEKIAPAVLNYERALLMSPGDSQIRHNLELARNKTQDKIMVLPELFIVTWYKSIVYLMSVDAWGMMGTVCFIIFLLMLSAYLFLSQVLYRKIGFYTAVVALLFCVLANIFALSERRWVQRHDTAVLMQEVVHVKSTPNQDGKDLFVIHAGTKVTIVDDTMRDWKEIRLDDGKTGWLEASSVEII